MKRREFIAGLGGAVAWQPAARAQQADRMRRIGVLMAADENDPPNKARLSAFTQAFANLGWTDGRNMRMDLRWGRGDTDRIRALAQELGLEFAVAGSPGWSESGGPWVEPGQGMKKLVWSEIRMNGGVPFQGKIPQPPATPRACVCAIVAMTAAIICQRRQY